MILMLLIGYLQGIRSERRLVEEVHLSLAHYWFCRLRPDGRMPDPGRFGHATNYLVDIAHGVIVVEAMPAWLSQEIVAAKQMLEWAEHTLGHQWAR